MEHGFFQASDSAFLCESETVSTLGAITCGYISAVWPLILILLVSLAMELNKRDFRIATKTELTAPGTIVLLLHYIWYAEW